MSRSWRKHPCGQVASCKSERWDKRFWHRNFRGKGRISCREIVKESSFRDWVAYMDEDCFCLERRSRIDFDNEEWDLKAFDIRQVSNPWMMNKDGKMWYIEDFTRKRDKVFRGKKVCWYCITEPEWMSDREVRKIMSK